MTALDLRVRPNEIATATLTLWAGGVKVAAKAEYMIHDPNDGQLKAVESIKFVNEAPIWCRENRIVTLGGLGLQRAYLNVDRQEAIRRYCASENISEPDDELLNTVREITLTDEFECYSIWAKRD